MIVVSDTSPISDLMTIGQSKILRELFGRIVIPQGVKHELEVISGFRVSKKLREQVLKDLGEA